MKQRFDELLPWYANGTLGDEDRAWVEKYLEEHPQARAELDWYRSLGQKLRDSAPAVPETIGLAKAMTLIRGDRPTFSERVSAFFAGLGMRPATAFAGLAIFAVQGGVILNMMDAAREDASEIRALRASVVEEGPMLKLNFAPDAKEAEIRHLLMSVQGRLAGGPGQLGDYFVIVPRGKEAVIAEQLKSNPIVAAVSLAPGLPPRE
ncbi:hypothetical protein [uncultured Piscinibacter sp.]|uniref:anti-sigma factor n=1 Tax=uncultured Piscinibacter sp. TaxID=1131835 RepID=UPI002627E4B8|nr:hypothetical protein [uncultured Piscinibacter sp.]